MFSGKRRLSATSFNSESVDLLLRTEPEQFTSEELAALASMDLSEPSEEELKKFKERNLHTDPKKKTSDLSSSSAAAAAATAETTKKQEEDEEDRYVAPRRTSVRPGTAGGTSRSRPGTSNGGLGRRLSAAGVPPVSASAGKALSSNENIFTILTKKDMVGGTEGISDAVLQTRHVELVERGLTSTELAECFLNATHVYLQLNHIDSLEGLQILSQLRVLVIHHNLIVSLQPLAVLDTLRYLDVSFNRIEQINPEWDLPFQELEYLNILGNPIMESAESEAVLKRIAEVCTELEMLNDKKLGGDDKDEREQEESAKSLSGNPRRNSPSNSMSSVGNTRRLQQTIKDAREGRLAASASPDGAGNGNQSQTFLTEEEARLVEQFTNRSKLRNELTRQTTTKEELLPLSRAEVSLEDQLEGGEGVRATDLLTDEVNKARQLHTKMYTDLTYANNVARDRVERAMEEQWDGVAKVVQSRHAAVEERRRRLYTNKEEEKKSKAYTEALKLLEEESRCKDLDQYRVSNDNEEPTSGAEKK